MCDDRRLYYFHIQHDWCELGPDCPTSYVNADDEWQAIEGILERLPLIDKMYSDSFIFKEAGSSDGTILSSGELICVFTLQPYLGDSERGQLRDQIRLGAYVRQDEQGAFFEQLMGHFATLPYFSNNDRILLKLASRGVGLVPCESRALYLDFERSCEALKASFGSSRHEKDAQGLLGVMFQRNEFIANEIDRSLNPGENGVLFLGHLHNLKNDMVGRLISLQIRVEEKNNCRAPEALRNLMGLS